MTENDLLPDEIYVRKTTKKGLSAVRPESPLAERKKINQHSRLNRTKYIRADLVSAPSTAAGGVHQLCHEAYEVYVQMEGGKPKTAYEGYLLQEMKRMANIIVQARNLSVEQQKTVDVGEAIEALNRIVEWVEDAFNGNPTIMEFLERDEATIRAHLQNLNKGESRA